MNKVLKYIREQNNITKDEMANTLGITRQTYYKYELGENELTIDIVRKIASKFNVDYVDIIENKIPQEFNYSIINTRKLNKKEQNIDIRIDIPQENIDKFKQVLLYILNRIGSRPNVGQMVIYKLLYFIDFDYYELYEEQLMGLKYIKNDFGPTPVSFAKIVKQMEKEELIEEIKTKRYDYEMTKYLPLVEADLSSITAKEIMFINEEIEKYGNKSATELSQLSHSDVPWIGTKPKDIIPYESVFYRTPDTSVRRYEDY